MNILEAFKAMDEGKTVRMKVNPEKEYRLAKDGETIVSRPIGCCIHYEEPGDEWRAALFFTRHIRGDWQVVE